MTEGPKWTDVAIVILTIGIVFFALMQWLEMRGSGQQTDQLVNYAKAQADAASDQADAAQQFSDTAEDINGRMSDAVEQLQAAARNAKESIRATRTAMQLDQRGWVGVQDFRIVQFEQLKPALIEFQVFNSGKSPALELQIAKQIWYDHISPTHGPNENWFKELKLVRAETAAPQARYPTTVEEPAQRHIRVYEPLSKTPPQATLYVIGRIEYIDTFKFHHWTEFCVFMSNFERREISYCASHNEMK